MSAEIEALKNLVSESNESGGMSYFNLVCAESCMRCLLDQKLCSIMYIHKNAVVYECMYSFFSPGNISTTV